MITDQEYLTDEDKICLLPEQLGSQIVANSNSLKLDRIMDSLEQAESFIIPKVDPKRTRIPPVCKQNRMNKICNL